MANKKNSPALPANFEAALARLETIVEEMENAELPLEDILQRYEEGTRLKKFCEEKLKEAEKRVQQIHPNSQDNPVITDYTEEKISPLETNTETTTTNEDLLL